MATTISRLSVMLTANTGPLSKGLSGASSSIGRFASVAAKGFAVMAAAAAAAATAVVSLVVKQARAIDETAKMAQRLGIATDALIGMQHAAALSGVSQSELATSIQRMERSISEASIGMGTAKRAFDQLGISAQELSRLSPEEQFIAIGEAIDGVQNQSDKMRVAVEILGRSGGGLINTFRGGGEAIRGAMEEAKQLGLTVTDAQALSVEKMNDSFTRLWSIVEGFGSQLAVQLAPILEKIVTIVVELIKQHDLAARAAQVAFTVITQGAEWAAFGIQAIVSVWHGLRVVALSVTKLIVDNMVRMQDAAQVVSTYIGRFFEVAFNGILAGLSPVIDALADLIIDIGHSVRVTYDDEMGHNIQQMGLSLRNQATGVRERFDKSLDAFGAPVEVKRTELNTMADGVASALVDAQKDFGNTTNESWSASTRDFISEAIASLQATTEKEAKERRKDMGGGAMGLPSARNRKERSRDALVVDLNRVAIGGGIETTEERQVSLLEQIAANTRMAGRFG